MFLTKIIAVKNQKIVLIKSILFLKDAELITIKNQVNKILLKSRLIISVKIRIIQLNSMSKPKIIKSAKLNS